MVGFGSSLRMARRPGWENAYLDYETLKLLLSQIEAVYEEEVQRFAEERRDLRYEMFLPDDSDDIVYQSVDESPPEESAGLGHHRPFPSHTIVTNPNFSLTYHRTTTQSSSEEEDEPVPGCGAAASTMVRLSAWNTTAPTTGAVTATHAGNVGVGGTAAHTHTHITGLTDTGKRTNKRRSHSEDDEYFVSGKTTIAGGTAHRNNTFILPGSDHQEEDTSGPSLFSMAVRHSNETSALLPPTTPGSSIFAFPRPSELDASFTPPTAKFYTTGPANTNLDTMSVASTTPATGVPKSARKVSKKQLERERNEERKQRRIQRQRKRRMKEERERRVPRHLRLAHAKARAITERFLGLLRAETEKVLLFAQSRLGELADTAGSLRFPSFDDEYGSSRQHDLGTSHDYDYPLADGGMHPSASSSSEDGPQMFPWSDASEEGDGTSHDSKDALPKTLSGGVYSVDNMSRSNTSTAPHHDSVAPGLADNSVRRQIAHFAELRKSRPLFQRNDQILGEDMLFLSALEEADGYTAVGVELLHVLRYICVNLIAVRKVCRKHDRLLMNRMLGGYYRRIGPSSGLDDTLGGFLEHSSGDVYEIPLPLLTTRNPNKLLGVYDQKIQLLANSRTVQVVSSCLAQALSEYEISRSRAKAITELNSRPNFTTPKRNGKYTTIGDPTVTSIPLVPSDDVGNESVAPSTATSISLMRLQFAVASIHALREAARQKQSHPVAYLARSTLAFCGPSIIGEGFDGCSRESLDFLVSYNPDSVLLLESNILYEGLNRGQWRQTPSRDLLLSAIATGMIPDNVTHSVAAHMVANEVKQLPYAISLDPTFTKIPQPNQRSTDASIFSPFVPEVSNILPPEALGLIMGSTFLYTMNYYVVHAASHSFVISTDASPAYTAVIVGVPNLSAIVSSVTQCWALSGEAATPRSRYNYRTIRLLLCLSASCAIVGNIVHARGIDSNSVGLVITGRLLLGFASIEIVQRQLLAVCHPSSMVRESAGVAAARVAGIALGLFFGAFLGEIPVATESFRDSTVVAEAGEISDLNISSLAMHRELNDTSYVPVKSKSVTIPSLTDIVGGRSAQSTSWVLMALWLLQFIRLVVTFRLKKQPNPGMASPIPSNRAATSHYQAENGSQSDASSSDSDARTPSTFYLRPQDDPIAEFSTSYGSEGNKNRNLDQQGVPGTSDGIARRIPSPDQTGEKHRFRIIKVFIFRLRRIMKFHMGIPVSFLCLLLTSFSFEVFFTGTPIITDRYFGWSGPHACVFMGLLASSILPIGIVCENASRCFEERTVMKLAIILACFGLFMMINWVSLVSLATRLPNLLDDTPGKPHHTYDWILGLAQYLCGGSIMFFGMTALEGSSLSLLSKISPVHLRSIFVNVGTMTTLLALMARLLANVYVLTVGLSHKLINTDIVNSLVLLLLAASLAIVFVVKRHFYYLI